MNRPIDGYHLDAYNASKITTFAGTRKLLYREPGMADSLDIAIVGCGPTGMAAALFLARAGNRVRIFERFEVPKPVGAGLLLQPTGLSVLDRLGLADQIVAAGARIDRLEGRALPRGRKILDVRYADLPAGLHGVGIHRASLFDVLHNAVAAERIEIVAGTPIAVIESAADGRPFARDQSGRGHGPFDLAVDASGAQSHLRLTLAKQRPRPFAYGALWTTRPLDGHGFEPSVLAQRYEAARIMIGVMPLGRAPGAEGPHAAFFWSIRRDGLERWRKEGLARWKEEVAALWPEAGTMAAGIERVDELQPAFYVHYTAKRPAGLRLALLGDAAHATSPQLGQGANMGLLDAAALADSLGRHRAVADALDDYSRARRRHVRFYQLASYWMTPLFQSDSAAAAFARDLAFPALARIPYLRRETVRALAGLKTGLFTGLGSNLRDGGEAPAAEFGIRRERAS